MEDTVTRARKIRQKQGLWEAEVSYGGEADLHRHLIICDKNPDHQNFVPVDQFNVDHLPTGCQDNDLVDYVRAVSDLTIRVSVMYVSEKRPEIVPGSGKPFPCYKNWGSNMMRTGTGWVWAVNKYPQDDRRYTTCMCQECLISPTPKTQFAHIRIQTANHVVYDELEAAHTTCNLFFDKGNRLDDCSGAVNLSGWLVDGRDVEIDVCEMIYVTHDLDLANKLDKMVDHWNDLGERIKNKLDRMDAEELKSSTPAEDRPNALDNLTIIVSHPHGCSKQVSVGYCVDSEERWGRMSPRTYTTSTCPGSSGAWVWLVKGRKGFYWSYGNVHGGSSSEENKNLNVCCDFFF